MIPAPSLPRQLRFNLYELTGPEAATYGEAAEIITDAVGKSGKHQSIPRFIAQRAACR